MTDDDDLMYEPHEDELGGTAIIAYGLVTLAAVIVVAVFLVILL